MIRVLLADDHVIVRRGLMQIFAETSDILVCGEAGSAAEVLRMLKPGAFDVLVLDITLPDKSGVEVLKRVRGECPNLPVVILSMHPCDQYALRLLKDGAAAYLTKESIPQQLVEAVRHVAQGGRYITPAVAELLSGHLLDGDAPAHQRLSDREFEILCQIASGKTVSQIAAALSLSVKTVSTHRQRILKKMRYTTNAELTHYAIKEGLVE